MMAFACVRNKETRGALHEYHLISEEVRGWSGPFLEERWWRGGGGGLGVDRLSCPRVRESIGRVVEVE